MPTRHRSTLAAARLARGRRGFALLEVLIAGLVFSIGVLGIVGLQAAMSKQQAASKYRAEATYLAGEIVGIMWSDQPNLAQYATAQCASHARCVAWSRKVDALLPSGDYAIDVDADGAVTVTISWVNSGGESQNFRMQTAIVI